MDQTPTNAQKRKRSLPRQIGCLKWLLIPIFVIAACYGGIWLFARFGGDWAMSDQIPLPPDSQQINVLYSDPAWTMKTVFYSHDESPDMLRDWFVDQGIYLTAGDYAANGYYTTEGLYTVQGYEIITFRRTLHRDAIRRTHPELLWIGHIQAGCGGWTVFKTIEAVQDRFPQVMLAVPEGKTIFAIHTCWPNVDKAPPNQPVYPVPLN